MTYSEALAYIHSVSWKGSRPGLSRISELCRRLGNPQRGLRFIHVAGTNGKGSFCRMLSGILSAAGYRTGLFTSPFVKSFNERIMIDNTEISDADLARDTETVRACADAMEDKPTEFELITAIGFVYFKRMQCDVVVLECGMGGRLDSTNVIEDPLLSVITGIDFDHTAYLGDTVEAIAAEKAGIVKSGCPCLWGGSDDSACRVIATVAAEKGSSFHAVDLSRLRVREMTLDGTAFDFGNLTDLHLSLLGTYQPRNAATVLTAVEILQNEGLNISEAAIRKGLATAVWHARFELLRRSDPVTLYDGGHNPQGVRAAAESIRAYFPNQKVNILSGVMADKDYNAMISSLAPLSARAFTVTPENPRSLSAADLAAHFAAHGVPAQAFGSVKDALDAAIADSRENGRPLVCLGSLYLYAELTSALHAVK